MMNYNCKIDPATGTSMMPLKRPEPKPSTSSLEQVFQDKFTFPTETIDKEWPAPSWEWPEVWIYVLIFLALSIV
jgi:hypothetical protein